MECAHVHPNEVVVAHHSSAAGLIVPVGQLCGLLRCVKNNESIARLDQRLVHEKLGKRLILPYLHHHECVELAR